jgi:UDP-N-acetylglucosamine transferase subunit ALG13
VFDRPYPAIGGTIRVLVTGGSQGARLLSDFTPAAIINLPEDLKYRVRVEQQTRMESLDLARTAYAEAGVEAEVAPFFPHMASRLEKAHLVIGRAGASTVCELAVAGKPSVLIPLKIAADDHQTHNAKLLADAGAAEVIREDKFTPSCWAKPFGPYCRTLTACAAARMPPAPSPPPTPPNASPIWSNAPRGRRVGPCQRQSPYPRPIRRVTGPISG